jgi:hypothetical protein
MIKLTVWKTFKNFIQEQISEDFKGKFSSHEEFFLSASLSHVTPHRNLKLSRIKRKEDRERFS